MAIFKKRIENESRRFFQVLSNPRQVGKSTIIRQLIEQTKIPHAHFNGEDVAENTGLWISQIWESARMKL